MSLHAVIPGVSLKPFSKILTCLSRIGEDLTIEVDKKRLSLSTINSSRSAYAIFTFSHRFFENYHVKVTDSSKENSKENVLICRVLIKALLSIFRAQKNSVERCELQLEEPGPANGRAESDNDNEIIDEVAECRLIVRLICMYGILKTHRLLYSPATHNRPLYRKDANRHSLSVQPKHLSNWVAHFYPKLTELTLECSPGGPVRFRSFHDEGGDEINYDEQRSLQTELEFGVDFFETYEVQDSVKLTFNFKEFKAIIAYAESIGSKLNICFQTGGSPILFSIQSANVVADIVLATYKHSDGTSDSSTIPPASQAPRSVDSSSAPAGNMDQMTKSAAVPQTSVSVSAVVENKKEEPQEDEEEPRKDRKEPQEDEEEYLIRRRPYQMAQTSTKEESPSLFLQTSLTVSPTLSISNKSDTFETGFQKEDAEEDETMLDADKEEGDDSEIPPTPPKKKVRTIFTSSQV